MHLGILADIRSSVPARLKRKVACVGLRSRRQELRRYAFAEMARGLLF
jgi:hypothetical protein